MIVACADLDGFFDGELAAEHAAAFRGHLGGCARCQDILHGRMQEALVVDRDRRAPVAVRPARLRLRVLAALAPVLGAAAVGAVMLATRQHAARTTPLRVELTVDHRGPAMRGRSAHPGDVLHVTAHGARYRAIWIYRDEHALVAVCPGAPSCRVGADAIGVDLILPGRGRHAIVALGAASSLPAPTGALAADLAAASTIDGSYQIGHLDIE